MAISFVSSATGTTTATMPSHQAGDLIFAWVFRDGSDLALNAPSGLGWQNIMSSTSSVGAKAALFGKVASSASEDVGVFSNATSLIVVVYRADSGSIVWGAVARTNQTGGTITYPALSLDDTSGSSWVAGFVGHRTTGTTVNLAPTGMINRAAVADAVDEAASHDTGGGVASWPATNQSVGGTSAWQTCVVEIKVTGGGAFTITADAGAFSDDGIDAGLRAARQMASAVAALVLSGQDAGTRATRRATAQAGTLSSAGQASPLASRQLDLDFTALTLAGQSGLVYGHPMVAAPATYVLAGDVGLSFLRGISGGVGAFSLSGSAGLRATRRLPLDTAPLALTGQDVDFPAQAILVGGAGAFALNSAAGLFLARKATSNAGSYAFAGAADLEYSRRVVGLTGAFSFSGSAGLLYGRAISATGEFALAGIDVGLIADITEAYIMAAETGVFAFAGLVDFARGGWAPVPPVGETWTAQGVTPETWVPTGQTPEAWTPETETDETWTPVPRRSETWQ